MTTYTTSFASPIIFETYFEQGQQEVLSPFITPQSRQWGSHLFLKSALLATVLLFFSFLFSFFPAILPISYLLLVIVYFLVGIPPLIESLEDLINFEVNIDVLMTLAAFSSVFIGSGMEGGLLLVLFAISSALEEAVTTRAKGAISSLHTLSPTTASVVKEDGNTVEHSVKEIKIGTIIRVKSGQVIPLDGIVVQGTSSINLVHLTGENLPVTKSEKDLVPAGAQNLEGALLIQVTRTSNDSTVAKIIQLVTQAQGAKPQLQRWFDRISRPYASTIICLFLFFSLSLPFLLQIPFLGREGSLYRALAFLIAASPCALIIALPIAYLSSISICAQRGILLKGGISLDALASCQAIAFDKTGTLTKGVLVSVGIEEVFKNSLEDSDLKKALAIAFALEQNAIHPIAKALCAYVKEKEILPASLETFQAIPGHGLEGKVEGNPVAIGRPEFILERIDESKREILQQKVETRREQGEIVAAMSWKEHVFLFYFQDTIRPGIVRTLKALKENWKMKIVMLTGDHSANALRIAKEVGIEHWEANLSPEDKLKRITMLAENWKLAMVGDGINDAPALARATVGICMGKVGTTAAMDASDIVLLHDHIELLDWLIGKARKTMVIVKQNLVLALIAIIFASTSALFGIVPLWLAVILHEGGTVLVGLNALRLLKK